MLQPEIEPFANFHRHNLLEIANKLAGSSQDFDQEILELRSAAEAFVRFRVCMNDEVEQKKRLRNQLLDLKFRK